MNADRILFVALCVSACGAFRTPLQRKPLQIGKLWAQNDDAVEGWPEPQNEREGNPDSSGGSRFREMMARAQESGRFHDFDSRPMQDDISANLRNENFGGVEVRSPSADASPPPPPNRRPRPAAVRAAVEEEDLDTRWKRMEMMARENYCAPSTRVAEDYIDSLVVDSRERHHKFHSGEGDYSSSDVFEEPFRLPDPEEIEQLRLEEEERRRKRNITPETVERMKRLFPELAADILGPAETPQSEEIAEQAPSLSPARLSYMEQMKLARNGKSPSETQSVILAPPMPSTSPAAEEPVEAPVAEMKSEAEAKLEPVTGSATELKTELKTDLKAELKTQSETEPKTESNCESKSEVMSEVSEVKSDLKLGMESEMKSEMKPDSKAESKAESTPEVQAGAKADSMPEVKTEAMADSEPGLKTESKKGLETGPAAKPSEPLSAEGEEIVKAGLEKLLAHRGGPGLGAGRLFGGDAEDMISKLKDLVKVVAAETPIIEDEGDSPTPPMPSPSLSVVEKGAKTEPAPKVPLAPVEKEKRTEPAQEVVLAPVEHEAKPEPTEVASASAPWSEMDSEMQGSLVKAFDALSQVLKGKGEDVSAAELQDAAVALSRGSEALWRSIAKSALQNKESKELTQAEGFSDLQSEESKDLTQAEVLDLDADALEEPQPIASVLAEMGLDEDLDSEDQVAAEEEMSTEDINTLRRATGFLIKHRGGPGFGAGRLRGHHIDDMEAALDAAARILQRQVNMPEVGLSE